MPRFLIQVPHDPRTLECARAVELFLTTGSHYLSHADWGCRDGEHTSWMTVEVGSREEARNILPPALRPNAKVVQLNAFALEEIKEIIRAHES
jgi:hypothetical protein